MAEWVIGDIHGCFYTLNKLINEVLKKDANPTFIFTGDYIDRGCYSKEVIDYILSLEKSFKCHKLLGNHDDVFKYFLGIPTITNLQDYVYGEVNFERVTNWMFQHGLYATLKSFNLFTEHDLRSIDNKYKLFFENLEIGYISDSCFVFHGCFPNREIPRDIRFIKSADKEELIWNRFEQEEIFDPQGKRFSNWDRIGIFGHTPTRYYTKYYDQYTDKNCPIIKNKLVLIDTGACTNGNLSAFCVQTNNFIIKETEERDLLC